MIPTTLSPRPTPIGPLRTHRAPFTTLLMLASCMRSSIPPDRRLPPAQPPVLHPFRAGERHLVGRRDACPRSAAEGDEDEGAAAVLGPRRRTTADVTARAAGCLEQRRPDHLGGVERRLSCKVLPTRRRAKTRDVGVQDAAARGQRTSRAARRAKDRPAEALSGRDGPPRPGQRRRL